MDRPTQGSAADVMAGAIAKLPRSFRVILGILALGLAAASLWSRVTVLDEQVLLRNDFTQDYVSAKAWLEGEDVYGRTEDLVQRHLPGHRFEVVSHDQRNGHPPAAIAVAVPLAPLRFEHARLVWMFVDAVSLVCGIALACRTFGMSRRSSGLTAVALLVAPVFQKELTYGQVNGVLLVLVVLAWRQLRAEHSARAGVLLGLAALLRLYPAFLLVPLARARNREAITAFVATFALGSLATGAAVGWEGVRTFWFVAAPENAELWRAAPMNLSLTAAPFRWLSQNVWHTDTPDLPIVATALAAALFLALVWVTWTASRGPDSILLAVLPMLLANPLTWELALTIALLSWMWLAHSVRTSHGVVAVTGALLLVGIPPGLPLPGEPLSVAETLLYQLPAAALLVLTIAWLRLSRDQDEVRERALSTA